MPSAHYDKYIGYDLTKQAPPDDADQLSTPLFDVSVDLHLHRDGQQGALLDAMTTCEAGGEVTRVWKLRQIEPAFREAMFSNAERA